MKNSKIAFIGAGNMARALVAGLISKHYCAQDIYVANRSGEKLNYFSNTFSVHTSNNNEITANEADIIVLAVKPAQIKLVCQELQTVVRQSKAVVVSIAAGVTIAQLSKWLAYDGPIVRAMPNTPVAIGLGATGLFSNSAVNTEQYTIVANIFSCVGISAWVECEDLLDVITAVSSSGPAYIFLMMQAMLTSAINLGLNAEIAGAFISQTVLGAGQLAQDNSNEFARLREEVTSPNGTTFAALQQFKQHNFTQIISDAMQAASQRSKEIAAEND